MRTFLCVFLSIGLLLSMVATVIFVSDTSKTLLIERTDSAQSNAETSE